MVSVIIKMRLRAHTSHCHLLSRIWLLLPRDTPSDHFRRRLHIVVSSHVSVCVCLYTLFMRLWSDNFTTIRSGTHSKSNRKAESETKTHWQCERGVCAHSSHAYDNIFNWRDDKYFVCGTIAHFSVLACVAGCDWRRLETPLKHLFISINSQFIYSAAVQLFMHVPMSHTHSIERKQRALFTIHIIRSICQREKKLFNFNLLSSVNPCVKRSHHINGFRC